MEGLGVGRGEETFFSSFVVAALVPVVRNLASNDNDWGEESEESVSLVGVRSREERKDLPSPTSRSNSSAADPVNANKALTTFSFGSTGDKGAVLRLTIPTPAGGGRELPLAPFPPARTALRVLVAPADRLLAPMPGLTAPPSRLYSSPCCRPFLTWWSSSSSSA